MGAMAERIVSAGQPPPPLLWHCLSAHRVISATNGVFGDQCMTRDAGARRNASGIQFGQAGSEGTAIAETDAEGGDECARSAIFEAARLGRGGHDGTPNLIYDVRACARYPLYGNTCPLVSPWRRKWRISAVSEA